MARDQPAKQPNERSLFSSEITRNHSSHFHQEAYTWSARTRSYRRRPDCPSPIGLVSNASPLAARALFLIHLATSVGSFEVRLADHQQLDGIQVIDSLTKLSVAAQSMETSRPASPAAAQPPPSLIMLPLELKSEIVRWAYAMEGPEEHAESVRPFAGLQRVNREFYELSLSYYWQVSAD